MKSTSLHPHDKLSHARYKLIFLTSLLTIATGDVDGSINLAHPDNQNGLYYSLHGIADEIDAALCELMPKNIGKRTLAKSA